jgi:DNA polymerase-3 subunit epsilon
LREIVLDTETTGLNPASGHRIVEIGCIELVNHVATDRHYWQYVNPERDMPEEAFNVHGLSADFLAKHPVFADVADAFLEFIGDAPLIIHNADFDMGFINAELKLIGRPVLAADRAIDTVRLARRKFPGAPASLDALCKRFQIDNSDRALHGALKDTRLLADVYLELIGGRQPDLQLAGDKSAAAATAQAPRSRREPRPHRASADELERHAAFLEKLSEPVWRV